MILKTFMVLAVMLSSTMTQARDVVAQIYEANSSAAAVLPAEVETKISKMKASPFAFYRGTAPIFYADMNSAPSMTNYINESTRKTWIQGDLHIANLGALQNAKGDFVFDVTDFDESYFGNFTWDLQRMAVSMVLAARENGIQKESDHKDIVQAFAKAYAQQIETFKGKKDEVDYVLNVGNTKGAIDNTIKRSEDAKRSSFLGRLTTVSSEGRKFLATGELVAAPKNVNDNAQAIIHAYAQAIPSTKRYHSGFYKVKDVKQKLGSGVGSLGSFRYYVLIEGLSTKNDDDVVLQLKQAVSSSVAIAAPGNMPTSFYKNNEAMRVLLSANAMRSDYDRLAGVTSFEGVSFVVSEKSPYEVDFDYTKLVTAKDFVEAADYIGKLVAAKHAKADKDSTPAISFSADKEIADSLTKAFEQDLTDFALVYAVQVDVDYKVFLKHFTR